MVVARVCLTTAVHCSIEAIEREVVGSRTSKVGTRTLESNLDVIVRDRADYPGANEEHLSARDSLANYVISWLVELWLEVSHDVVRKIGISVGEERHA